MRQASRRSHAGAQMETTGRCLPGVTWMEAVPGKGNGVCKGLEVEGTWCVRKPQLVIKHCRPKAEGRCGGKCTQQGASLRGPAVHPTECRPLPGGSRETREGLELRSRAIRVSVRRQF